jgi:hypothetical protein
VGRWVGGLVLTSDVAMSVTIRIMLYSERG